MEIAALLRSSILARAVPGMISVAISAYAHAAVPAVAPSFGPPIVVLFGLDVPVLSAVFGLAGVVLARRVAPPSAVDARLGRGGRAALTALLALGVVALIISGQKEVIVALGWSIGLGYSGMAVIELLATSVMAVIKLAIDAFSRGAIAIATAKAASKEPTE